MALIMQVPKVSVSFEPPNADLPGMELITLMTISRNMLSSSILHSKAPQNPLTIVSLVQKMKN